MTDKATPERTYTETEVQALVAAAYEVAAKACEQTAYAGSGISDETELGCLRSRDAIRALTPADAAAALERIRAEEWASALRWAADAALSRAFAPTEWIEAGESARKCLHALFINQANCAAALRAEAEKEGT